MMRQVLALKYRPHHFSEVIGQPHVVQALKNALDRQYLHHAYLLTGTSGVGKTTLGRIIAKCLNCEKAISANPCDQCENCKEVDAGCFPDLLEVDAASRTKVEDTRELLDNVQYAPTKGRFKVYLIDEVHMLSVHSFNALLKTLEEPPAHVKFLLATTDPQKLPATVLSRCLQFHLLQMPPEPIAEYLANVLTQENIKHDRSALLSIGKAARGSMRDALSLLDQAIAFGNGTVLATDVNAMLGNIEATALYDILTALAKQNGSNVLAASHKLAQQGANFDHALAELLSMLHQIALAQVVPETKSTLDTALQQLVDQLSREDVQLYYQIGLMAQRDLPFAPSPRSGFEMALIRMLAFTPEMNHSNPAQSTQATKPSSTTLKTAQHQASQTSWPELLTQLALTGPTKALVQECSFKSMTESMLHLSINVKQKALLNDRHIERIQVALSNYFDRPMNVKIDVENLDLDTPARLQQRQREHQKNMAQEAIYGDKQVQQIMQTFDAKVVEDSISLVEH